MGAGWIGLLTGWGSRPQAAAKSLTSGVDVSLWDEVFPVLEEAVLEGLIAETAIDDAVRRVLLLKENLACLKKHRPMFHCPVKKRRNKLP